MQATTIASNFCKHNFWACSHACGHTSLLYLLITAFLPATDSWTSLPVSFKVRQKNRDILQLLSFWLKEARKDWPCCWGGTLKKQVPAGWRSCILSWVHFSLFPELYTIAQVYWGERLILSSTLPPVLRLLLCVLLLSPCCLAHTTLDTTHQWLWMTRDTGQLQKLKHWVAKEDGAPSKYCDTGMHRWDWWAFLSCHCLSLPMSTSVA